jgi:integrase
MSRPRAKPLTAVAVANARPGLARREIHDGHGLFLIIQPSGHKSWALRYRFRGLSRKLTLGDALIGGKEIEPPTSAPQLDAPLSLMDARVLALQALRQARSGVDPAAQKRQQRNAERAREADSLRNVCDRFLELVQREQPMRTIDQRRADLDLLCEKLGRLPIDTITKEQFVDVFDKISTGRGPVRSDRVLMATKRLLKWYAGRRTGYVSVVTDVARRTSIKERARKRVLSDPELKQVWLTAEKYPAPYGPYIRFLLLTATRRDEAGDMVRSELCDGGANWVIPQARLKQGKKSKQDMLVPLSKAAQAIVVAAQPPGIFVFAGRNTNKGMDNHSRRKKQFNEACGLAENWTLHDLRRTARTLMSRLLKSGVHVDTAERALGHAIIGARSHYDHFGYSDEKRDAFEQLAALIERIVRPPPSQIADFAKERGKRRR